MNKKFYLGAILLGAMTLSTGALTSCIDNDEPEGITNLRGAKAELLRAKAAFELAKAETEKQNANLVAAKVKIKEAIAKQEEAIAKQEEAIGKQEEAKAKIKEAKSEQEKAAAMEAMAKAQEAQAAAEASIAVIKAQNELDLQDLKNQLLAAQNNYDKLVAEIEAAKAVLTDVQAQKLVSLQDAVDVAWKKYKFAETAVLIEMNNVFNATTGEEDTIERLEKVLADNQAKLEAINAAYAELKALADEATPTAWEARRDSLDNYANKASRLEIAELQLQKDEIKQSAEYKAADKEDKAALGAYTAAQQENNYLANGNSMDCFVEANIPQSERFGYEESGTHPVSIARSAKKYDLQGASIAINNPIAFQKIQAAIDPAYLTTVDDNYFKVAGSLVSEGNGLTYDKLNNAFNPLATSGNPYQAKAVAAWADALDKISVTDEEIAADNCVADYEKAVADAEKAHKEAVAKWEKAHKTYADQKVAETVSKATIKAAIGLYNANIEALVAAVDAYNTAYDAAASNLKSQYIEKEKIIFARDEINAVLTTAVGTVGNRTTLAQIDALIDSSTKTPAEKTQMKSDYRTQMNNKWNTKTVADIN